MSITILYHDVTAAGREDSSGFSGANAARYKLTPEDFARHLDRISSVIKQPPLASADVDEFRISEESNWMITFDDGGLSAYTDIAEQLEQRGWRGWFFFATDFIGTASFCTREQIQELHRRGHVIGSHSCSHPERISNCAWDELVQEWSQSCQILGEIIQAPITTASVPGGFYSRDVARAASVAGVRILFNSEPTTATFRVDQTLVLGRYNVYRGMSAADAALMIESPLRRWRQSAFWNLKKAAKTFAAPIYKIVRQRILARDYGKD